MISYSAPANLPRLPSGIDGVNCASLAATREMISKPGFATSMTAPQLAQATASVVFTRLVSGAPQPGHLNANACAVVPPADLASRRCWNLNDSNGSCTPAKRSGGVSL